MRSSIRFDRLHRLGTRLREQASTELVRRSARVTAIERELVAVRAAEDASRSGAVTAGESGALVLAWAHADALARRAIGLLDDRMRAVTSAEGARETARDRRREEEQLARLATRMHRRADDRVARESERTLDELALWSHGRTR